jgi:hypothetical protein
MAQGSDDFNATRTYSRNIYLARSKTHLRTDEGIYEERGIIVS